MTLNLAKSRRREALDGRGADRTLVQPAAHHSQVRLPQEGTAAAYLIDALGHGCSGEELERATGWSKSTVMVNLYKVAKKCGVGIRRRDEHMFLMLPKGSEHIYPRPKVVAHGSTVRSTTEDVVLTASPSA